MKKSLLIVLALAFALSMVLAGCGEESSFTVGGTEEGTVYIEAENSEINSYALSGAVVADKEGKIHVDFDFGESGKVKIQLIRQDDEQSIDMSEEELLDMANSDQFALEVELSGKGTADYNLEKPGDYNVLATVLTDGLTGTATISGK